MMWLCVGRGRARGTHVPDTAGPVGAGRRAGAPQLAPQACRAARR
jgi:hypothetical protein